MAACGAVRAFGFTASRCGYHRTSQNAVSDLCVCTTFAVKHSAGTIPPNIGTILRKPVAHAGRYTC